MNDTSISVLLMTVMEKAPTTIHWVRHWFDKAKVLDFLAPLLIRCYLAPVLWMAGAKKFTSFTATAEWFGNEDWGLGLPAPYVMVFLVGLFEILGSVFLLFGFATRLMSLPLMVIMAVAAVTAHWQNGWLAIATGSGPFATERTIAGIERLESATEILQTQGDYAWLTEYGSFVVLNNGIEFAATYFVMLLVLFFTGGGRFVSTDYWLTKYFFKN